MLSKALHCSVLYTLHTLASVSCCTWPFDNLISRFISQSRFWDEGDRDQCLSVLAVQVLQHTCTCLFCRTKQIYSRRPDVHSLLGWWRQGDSSMWYGRITSGGLRTGVYCVISLRIFESHVVWRCWHWNEMAKQIVVGKIRCLTYSHCLLFFYLYCMKLGNFFYHSAPSPL